MNNVLLQKNLRKKFDALLQDKIDRIRALTDVRDENDRIDGIPKELNGLNCEIARLFQNASNGDMVNRVISLLPSIPLRYELEKQFNAWRLAGIVFVGFLVGGILSTLLGFFNLGGEILRPITIFCLLLVSEFFEKNEFLSDCLKAFIAFALCYGFLKKIIVLAISPSLILSITSEVKKLFNPRQDTVFKSIKNWSLILIGAFLFCCIKSDIKRVAVDCSYIMREAENRFLLLSYIFEKMNVLYEKQNNQCFSGKCSLVKDLIPMLEFMSEEHRLYIKNRLKCMGYDCPDSNTNNGMLVWNAETHERYYKKLGIINEGDECTILEDYFTSPDTNNSIIKGTVQKIYKKEA